jgi:predicted phage terminase large subunit-like protein
VTTTPQPVKHLKELLAEPGTVITRGSTYENRSNLAPAFFEQVIRKYEGTRLGRQELMAEILDDADGALWSRDMIDSARVRQAPEMARIVIGVDPAVTSGEESDETGIIVAGHGQDGEFYVMDDLTCRLSPDGWARRVVSAYDEYGAERIVAEVNNGGDFVEHVIRTIKPRISYRAVRATRGKFVRAEPIAALYEQGRVHHVGAFGTLEDQMCSFVPDSNKSPDHLDALVWALTELAEPARKFGVTLL